MILQTLLSSFPVPGAVLNLTELKKQVALIPESLQIGGEGKISNRWGFLMQKDGQQRGRMAGGLVGERHTHLGLSLESSTPASPSGLALGLSQIALVPSCLLPATFQLNHSLKFGTGAKTPLPCNGICTVSTAAPASLITCCCNLHH